MPREIDPAITPGITLGGRYVVRRRLGFGGMGSVWCVYDNRTDEHVALKVLPPQAGGDALGRFRREVTLARRIAHPNVCRVFDLGEPGGLNVLTMELIEGESLRARLARGPLPWVEARRLIDDLLAGLAAVHAAGVVHRDIKPENILIASDGRPVIVDFGLAWSPAAQVSTVPEAGTPQYMSPEQLSGGAIDPRSDVFAAGMAIQEILDGRSPFEGDTIALVASSILRDLPRPLEGKEVPAGIRAAVSRLIARALSRAPAARQADAGELRKEWLTALARASAAGPGLRIGRAIGVGLALVGATAAVTLWVSSRRGGPPAASSGAPVAVPACNARSYLAPDRSNDVFGKPASFIIVPPWAPGKTHTIVQGYGTYQHQNTIKSTYANDFHALDFDFERDEPVYPIANGTVVYVGPTSGAWADLGNIVLIAHVVGGRSYQSVYGHLSSVENITGPVTPTTMIGRAGRTGLVARPTLHLAIYRAAGFIHDATTGTGPYGGEAVIPEPFASCTKSGGACEALVAGDVLVRSASR